jgi:UDP-2,4-diacetamido-2,4,6-trideoxy-beta-L-altropyranose hydrolase
MKAVFRCAASETIGAGHIMRCASLSKALNARGCATRYVVNRGAMQLVRTALGETVDVCEEAKSDSPAQASFFRDADLIVVDDYDLDHGYESELKATGARIVACDDRPGRSHAADILLDPTPGREPQSYASLVPASCTLLLGSDYALLRDEFREARMKPRPVHGRARPVVLVSMGGTDAKNATARVLDELADATADFDLVVVLGRHAPHRGDIADRISRWSGTARIEIDPVSMAALLETADIAIGAPGVSASERACVGVPQILVHTAGNQADIAAALVRESAALDLGPVEQLPVSLLARQVDLLAQDAPRRAAMAKAGQALFDGDGAARVAAILSSGATARDGSPVIMRRLRMTDEAVTYAWQCDPETRKFARNAQIPSRDEHADWIRKRVADIGDVSEILLYRGIPAGIVRLDRRPGGQLEVSIVIAPGFRQLGIGSAALSLVRKLRPDDVLLAHILSENAASRSVFACAGYIEQNDGNWLSIPHATGGGAAVQ